jgi:hypothetical protein
MHFLSSAHHPTKFVDCKLGATNPNNFITFLATKEKKRKKKR